MIKERTQHLSLALLFIFSFLKPVFCQESAPETNIVNFFIDCDDCDFDFVRDELPFVSFVRDPQLADVHILVTDSDTGSGGNKYFLNFIGMKRFKGINYDYTTTTNQSDTDDDVRKTLLKLIQTGIMPYYAKSGFINRINIDLKESGNKKADDLVIDRWNKWVYKIKTGSEFQKEVSQNEYSLNTEVSADRITEEWKTSCEANYEINRENYFDDDDKITDKQDTKGVSAEIIKSLSEKWSAGLFGEYSSRTFLNIKNKYSVAAGIQYDIYPWKECNRRVFAVGYGLGVDLFQYHEITIYEKMHDRLLTEILLVNLDLIQPWGEISVELMGQNYFNDFSKNRVTLASDLSVRLTKNLSINLELQSQLIHDQLYLPKGDASLEDILLKRRKLATTYEISGQIGFKFTFGSIYNNIVNERF